MNRREFLQSAGVLPAITCGCVAAHSSATAQPSMRRVRPRDPLWPSQPQWEQLRRNVGGRLLKLESPLAACAAAPQGPECAALFRSLRNPFFIGDHPALTQTSGWADAWTSTPSCYAIVAESAGDVVAAVNFAREHSLRLVVKGGGHSYQGTSCSPDSLLIWTRRLSQITVHDAFVPDACKGAAAPQPAVTLGAGVLWVHAYDAVTTRAGRYVQGGGCTTVGVAGLIQSGGFGSFSKNYGLAAAGLIEAEIVTADGAVRIVNACRHPDLYWALKGGGGGTFGVVTSLTLRTRALPERFGAVTGTITARSLPAFRQLTSRLMELYRDRLFNPNWGEQIRFEPDSTVRIQMLFQGLTSTQAEEAWRSFTQWVAANTQDFEWRAPLAFIELPARRLWDEPFLSQFAPDAIGHDDRPGASPQNFFWAGDGGEAGNYLHGYRSVWLPAALLANDAREALVDAVVRASRHWEVALHFNKGLAGAPPEEVRAARDTATNPLVLDACALVIIAGNSGPVFPGVTGREPDLSVARRNAAAINRAMSELQTIGIAPAAYVSESDYFERDWQRAFWGTNYARLLSVKRRYDPNGLFFVRHGVGSEQWSEDGFTRG